MGAYDDYAAASKARYLKERAEAEQERRRREFWLTVEAVFAPAFVQKLRRWSK